MVFASYVHLQGELKLEDGGSYVGNFKKGKYHKKVGGVSSSTTGLPIVWSMLLEFGCIAALTHASALVR